MSVLNELLQYQSEDMKLRKIEQEIAADESYRKYVQAKKFLKTAGEKLEAQDRRAVELRHSVQTLTARAQELNEALSEYAAVEDEVANGGDVSFYKRSAQALTDNIRALRTEINKLISEIEAASAEFKKMKEQTIAMQKQYKEYSEKVEAVKRSHEGTVKEINANLAALEKKIPEDILAKYKQKRKEKIFPVLAALTKENRCVCGMSFPIAQQSRLSGGNVVECDHCHRFIYTK